MTDQDCSFQLLHANSLIAKIVSPVTTKHCFNVALIPFLLNHVFAFGGLQTIVLTPELRIWLSIKPPISYGSNFEQKQSLKTTISLRTETFLKDSNLIQKLTSLQKMRHVKLKKTV